MIDSVESVEMESSQVRKYLEISSPSELSSKKLNVVTKAKRKAAVCRVFLRPGKGEILVNKKQISTYFTVPEFLIKPFTPFSIISSVDPSFTIKNFDVYATISGGGFKGQSEALMYAISAALAKLNINFSKELRASGLLTLDVRKVERKKYGLRKARKDVQFSKR